MGYFLHSHAITYGSGSQQQSVTGLENEHDTGSLWSLKEGEGEDMCATGEKIRCGSTVRLEHMSTARNLHSHKFDSPVSGRQEISAFGENGEGDTGDNWELECESGDEYLRAGGPSSSSTRTREFICTQTRAPCSITTTVAAAPF